MNFNSDFKNYDYYVNADLTVYAGEWVAIINKKVVAHEKSVKKLISKVKESYPKITPFVVKVPAKEILIW